MVQSGLDCLFTLQRPSSQHSSAADSMSDCEAETEDELFKRPAPETIMCALPVIGQRSRADSSQSGMEVALLRPSRLVVQVEGVGIIEGRARGRRA